MARDVALYPHAEAAKADLAFINYEEVFAVQLEMYLNALALAVSKDE